MRTFFAALFFFTTAPGVALAAETTALKVGDLNVTAWLPAETKGAPVIIFSHGFHGCGTQSEFLTKALADAGYAVFAPDHADAACRSLRKWFERPDTPLRQEERWDRTTYVERGRNIKTLLDALPKDERFRDLDWRRVGLAGHSLGGYTVLGVSGAWPSWKDNRIKAVLAVSPYVRPFVNQNTLGRIGVPVMYQGGTRDGQVTPWVTRENGAYAQSSTPKYYMELDGAGHFAWADVRTTFHDTINRYTIAFFDTYLKDKAFPDELTKPQGQVSQVWIETK